MTKDKVRKIVHRVPKPIETTKKPMATVKVKIHRILKNADELHMSLEEFDFLHKMYGMYRLKKNRYLTSKQRTWLKKLLALYKEKPKAKAKSKASVKKHKRIVAKIKSIRPLTAEDIRAKIKSIKIAS